MNDTATPQPQPRTGQLDDAVRGLLRCFLSPGVADRVAGALQPVAHEDREVALRAAAELLQDRFGVQREDLAAAMVDDLEQPVEETAELLGMSPVEVYRVTAIEPPEVSVASVSPSTTTTETEADEEHATWLPDGQEQDQMRSVGVAAALVAGMAVVVVLVTLAVVSLARGPDDAPAVAPQPQDTAAASSPATGEPTAEDGTDAEEADGIGEPLSSAAPDDGEGASATEQPVAAVPTALSQLRFVTEVDPLSGEAGEARAEVSTEEDVRAWARLAPPPAAEVIVEMTFTSPDGARKAQSLRLAPGIDVVVVRLPEELGRQPGRYVVEAVLPDGAGPMLRAEVRLVAPVG